MSYETITYEIDDRVAVVTLNRPEVMNAMSLKLCAEVKAAVAAAADDPEVRVVVVRGAGGKAFSAGYDLMDPGAEEFRQGGVESWNRRMNHDLQFTYSVWRCSKPTIAMIEGYCLAGGLEFAQMHDIRYCSDDSRFGVVETRFSAGVATMAMPWILGQRCRELIYTGDIIGAEEAKELGLVNRVFPKADLEAEVMKIAKRMSRVAMDCLRWNKRAINQAYETMGFHAALAYGAEAASILDGTETPELKQFNEIRRDQGLKAANAWRKAQFAEFE